MVTGTAKLVVDLGNSQTRVNVLFGRNNKGIPRSKISVLSNRYAEIPAHRIKDFISDGIYSEEDSVIFTLNGTCYCNGSLCDTEYAQTSFRPTAMEKKYGSLPTKLALINAFRKGYETVARFAQCDMGSLDLKWEVYLLLPPEDMDNGRKKLAEVARSIDHIDFQLPEIRKDIVISSIMVYPEGLCAFLGTILRGKDSIREGYEYLITNRERTLICDVGAGTTDFLMVRGSELVSTSRFTRDIGGNNVHRLVQRSLRNQEGIVLPDSDVAIGCETGYVKSGGLTVDIREHIADAKRRVSQQLVEAVQEFFESSMIHIQTIHNILVVGGGAEPGTDGIEPISTYVVEYIQQLAPNIKVLSTPSEVTESGVTKLSPRMLNILGASIMAERA
jgi:hypothetical protein